MQGKVCGFVRHILAVLVVTCVAPSLISNGPGKGPPGLSYKREELLTVRDSVDHGSVNKCTWQELINCNINSIKPTRRGLSGGQKLLTGSGQPGCLQTITSTSERKSLLHGDRGPCLSNLIQISTKKINTGTGPRKIRVATVNARSIRNKIDLLHDLVI